MAADVGRDRAVAFPERSDHRTPAGAGVREAVQQDERPRHRETDHDRHRHLPAAARVLRRARALRPASTPARRPARAARRSCSRSCASRGSAAGRTSTSAAPASSRWAPRRPSGRPVAVTCTSGTAAANLAPAVIEAYQARVPLIVLTADRPPELRDVGAGQTIDQLKLYGDAVKWFFEVGVARGDGRAPALDPAARVPRVLDRARRTTGSRPPELPAARAARARRAAARGHERAAGRWPWVVREPTTLEPARGRQRLPRTRRRRRRPPRARSRSSATPSRGSPSAPAIRCSPIRCPAPGTARRRSRATTCCCATQRFTATRRPELVIRVGDLPTSKPLRSWLARCTTSCRSRSTPRTPGRTRPAVLTAKVARRSRSPCSCSVTPPAPIDPDWLAAWRAADDAASDAIDSRPRRRALRAARRRAPERVAPAGGDPVRRLLDADPRRRAVLRRPRAGAARALQPRRERDRRHRLLGVRRGRRRATDRSCC